MRKQLGKCCHRCHRDDWYVRPNGYRNCAWCSLSSRWKCDAPTSPLGRQDGRIPKAVCRPMPMAIAWAAGVFEGEGSACYANQTTRVSITQNDRAILEVFMLMFGGRVHQASKHNALSNKPCFHWVATGSRARGFGMTIYQFLSSRRKRQMYKALHLGKPLPFASGSRHLPITFGAVSEDA